jgi:hypothetical protein
MTFNFDDIMIIYDIKYMIYNDNKLNIIYKIIF